MKFLFVFLSLLMMGGCATLPSGKTDPRDPWERFNRGTFKFNEALDRAVAKPVAKAYVKVTPRVLRTGVSNVFNKYYYSSIYSNLYALQFTYSTQIGLETLHFD